MPLAMETAQIFDHLFAKHCKGIYMDIDEDETHAGWRLLLNDLRTCVDHVNRSCPNKPEIVIGFMSSTAIGAIASKYEDKYYIGMYLGTCSVLLGIFSRLLTSPNVFTYYGDATKEVVKGIPSPFITSLLQLVMADKEFCIPKDPSRQRLSMFLVLLAMRYLVLHENGHIIHGHLDYVLQAKSQTYWESLTHNQYDNPSPIDPIHSQVMEYDADAFASNASMRYVWLILNGKFEENAIFAEFYVNNYYKNRFIKYNIEQILILHSFSCQTVFRLFFSAAVEQSQLGQLTHLPPSIRLLQFTSSNALWVADMINRTLSDQEKIDAEVIMRVIAEAAIELKKGFRDLSPLSNQEEINNSGQQFALAQTQHLSLIQRKWNEVRILIEPYTYTDLAPAWEL